MSAISFLIALAALSIGTYVMRFAGVKLGGAIATKGRPVGAASARNGAAAGDGTVGDGTGGEGAAAEGSATSAGNSAAAEGSATSAGAAVAAEGEVDSTARVTMWMDRATVVLIGAVFATTAIFDGKDLADPARLIGVGVGVLASILRVPMLICVLVGMGVCAGIRMTGIL